MRSILIKDTTREEREQIIRESLDCGGGGCENCSSCWLGGGSPLKYSILLPKNTGTISKKNFHVLQTAICAGYALYFTAKMQKSHMRHTFAESALLRTFPWITDKSFDIT